MLSEFSYLVQLNTATLRCGPGANLDDTALIENICLKPTRPAFADPGHETSDALFRQKQAWGKGIRAHLNEVIAVGRPADGAETVAVQEQMRVLMRVRESPAQKMMTPIGDD